jgi:hypothetical protein
VQQQAYSVIQSEIQKFQIIGTPEANKWELFISRVLWELCVYGYVVYRIKGDALIPTLLSGRYCHISRVKGEWRVTVARYTSPANEKVLVRAAWQVLVFAEPETTRNGRYMFPTSFAQKSAGLQAELDLMTANLGKRDWYNSVPSIYTRMSKELTMSTVQSRPWFNGVHSNMVPQQIAGRVDFNTLVKHRAETIAELDHLSERARRLAASRYRPTRPGVGMATHAPVDAMIHREHIVTDGKDINEQRHLQGPENTEVHIDKIINNIFFMWGVPPQVLGKNINSERIASSNRLTEMAIAFYHRNIKQMKGVLESIFDTMNSRTDQNITFNPCVSMHVINELTPVLKPQKLLELYACCHDMDPSYFDLAAIKRLQLAGEPEERKHPKPKSEEAKDDTARKKAKVTPGL